MHWPKCSDQNNKDQDISLNDSWNNNNTSFQNFRQYKKAGECIDRNVVIKITKIRILVWIIHRIMTILHFRTLDNIPCWNKEVIWPICHKTWYYLWWNGSYRPSNMLIFLSCNGEGSYKPSKEGSYKPSN